MLDDELLLKAAEGVDYSSLPSMPTPEDFYLLSRVKGETTVAQLCAASGWGKDKAKQTIEKLIGFGLLVSDGDDAPASSAPAPEHEKTPIAGVEAPAQNTAQTQEGPAVEADDEVAARQRAETPERTPVVDRDPPRQEPNRDHVQTPVRDEPQSSFDLPVVEEEEDDLFMSDSPAHLSRIKQPGNHSSSDPGSTRPFDEGADFVSTLEAETNAGEDSEPQADSDPGLSSGSSEPGFAILDSEVAEDSDRDDGATKMLDPTSLDIATSVATIDTGVETNRRGGAVEGPLAFAMLPGMLDQFTLDPNLLDPALQIDAKARQEVAYVHAHLDSVNHYQLFGVTPEANRKEIKKAYFVLSKRFHPDLYFRKNVGPFAEMVEDVFKAVTGAYGILSHRKKRAEYDAELKAQANMPPVESGGSESAGNEMAEKRELARELLIKRGRTHEVKGEFVRAADAYRKAIVIRSDPDVLVKLGNALYKANKRLDDAAKYCRNALRQDPENLDGMLVLAKILERNEMFDDALRVLDRAKSIAPDEASITVHQDRIRSLMADG